MMYNISAVIHGSLLMCPDSWNRALKHWIKVHNDLPRSAQLYSRNAIMDNTHQVDARYQYRFAYGDIVCYPLAEKERRWEFDTKNEMGFYLGDNKCMKALLPQDPNQRRCASSTHIRDRAYGMVREASTCKTIGTVMGSGRGSHRRTTQGQAVHESKRPKTTRRGQRHLGRQRPGRHGTGATIAYARSIRIASPQYNRTLSRDTAYRGALSRSQTFIHPRAEAASKLYRGIVQRR